MNIIDVVTNIPTYRAEHHGAGVLDGKACGEPVHGVVVDTCRLYCGYYQIYLNIPRYLQILTVGDIEDDDADKCEVEEWLGPGCGVHHGEHDRDDQDEDLHQHRPHDTRGQVVANNNTTLYKHPVHVYI